MAVYGQCKATTGIFKIQNFTTVKSCEKLDSALANQPISIALDATNMYNYDSGIFSACSTTLNNAGLLVGVSDNGGFSSPFYKVKMNFGTDWGERGFIRLAKVSNICGICEQASFPAV